MSIINKSYNDDPIVIVGGGMASHRMCKSLSVLGYQTSDIKIYSEESLLPYDRANLSKCFSNDKTKPNLLSNDNWYKQKGINVHLATKVLLIEPNRRLLKLDSDQTVQYSKLVLALGANPSSQLISGADLQNVFTYRNWVDLQKIKAVCSEGTKVAIVGGGLLGLEAADAIYNITSDVTVFEMANTLLCRNLNEEAGFEVSKALNSRGIKVVLKAQLKNIFRRQEQLNLVFNNREEFQADVVILAIGHRPADELAKQSGIAVSPKGGILVDHHLRTSHKDIYALGDCISLKHKNFGFVQPTYQQADTLASIFCGSEKKYEPKGRFIRLNVSGMEISAYGDNLGNAEHLTYQNKSVYRSLVIHRGVLIGSTTIGEWANATALRIAVEENVKIPNRHKKIFDNTGELKLLDEFGEAVHWPKDSIICNCYHITCETIRKAITNGHGSLTKIENLCGAGSKCGSCRLQLLGLIHSNAENRTKEKNSFLTSGNIFKYLAFTSLLLCILYWAPWQVGTPITVESPKFRISKLWTDSVIKQITGFTTAGISLFSLLYSLRKRLSWFRLGNVSMWKTLHVFLGCLTLIVLFLHTGLSWGYNLNFLLTLNFILLNTLGALAAFNYSAKLTSHTLIQNSLRFWIIRLHILFFWPYPVLLGIHIYKVYQY